MRLVRHTCVSWSAHDLTKVSPMGGRFPAWVSVQGVEKMPDSVRPRFSAQVMEGPLGCSILFVILVALVMFPLTVASWEEGTEGVSAEREERQWCPLHARGGAWRGSRLQTTDDRRCFSQPSLAVVGHRFQREDQEGCRAMCTRPGLRNNRLPATTSLGRLQDSISVSLRRADWPGCGEKLLQGRG